MALAIPSNGTSAHPVVTVTASSNAAADADTGVESPSLSYPSARARFEFEPGRGNEGTKILMVEWEDDETTKNIRGTWSISWDGQTQGLAAEDRGHGKGNQSLKENDSQVKEHRLFFMLPPRVSVPPTVVLTLRPAGETSKSEEVVWNTNPLPAIFPPSLTAKSGESAQGKGVLHTLWAKKRLQTLSREIDREAADNVEGVALAMAIREKEWIESSFGVSLEAKRRPPRIPIPVGDVPLSPATPMSPGGSRLADRLKGLKIQTGDSDLKPRSGMSLEAQLVSPEESDVAFPSISAFGGANLAALAAKPPQVPTPRRVPSATATAAAASKVRQESTMGSLSGIVSGTSNPAAETAAAAGHEGEEEEGDLFAMPLSARSPDMTKSPFAFARSETGKHAPLTEQQKVS